MLNQLVERVANPTALVVLSVALMLFLGFAMTRITKHLRLPNVTAYIITGILLGPYFLDIIPANVVEGTDFLADIALAFIAFCVGEHFLFSTFKKNGMKSLIIAVFESIAAALLIFILLFVVLRLELALSLVLSTLAAVTASTSTMMTIRQMKAKGDFVNTLLQVIAIDNVLGLVAFSISLSLAATISGNEMTGSVFANIALPIAKNIAMIVLGILFAYLLLWFIHKSKHSKDNRLIISVGVLFLFCGVCGLFEVSPLLGCMAMGTVYRNVSGDENLFKQLNYFSPPFLLLFFVRSGLTLDLDALFDSGAQNGAHSLLLIAVLYFLVRIVGKYFGAFLGSFVVGKPKSTQNYLGLALIPQAGVSIGLAALCTRSLNAELGGTIQTVILAAGIMYELVGPVLAKYSLFKSGAYSNKLEEITTVETKTADGKDKSPIDILVEQLQQIQEEITKTNSEMNENEKAFIQAAEEQEAEEFFAFSGHGRFLNRR